MTPRIPRPDHISMTRTIEAQTYINRLLNAMGESATFGEDGLSWKRVSRLRVYAIGRKWIHFTYVRWQDEYLPGALIEYMETK